MLSVYGCGPEVHQRNNNKVINLLRRSLRNPSLLLALLLVATLGGVLGVVKITIAKQDKLFIQHSQQMVSSGLELRRQQLVGALREYSIWDAMADRVNQPQLDLEWLRLNMSGSAYVNQHINIEALVDRQQQVNYLLVDGHLVPPSARGQALAQLVSYAFPLAEHYNPYGHLPSPLGIVRVEEAGAARYYMVTMEPVVPENSSLVPSDGRFLLFASALDGRWLNTLSESFRLLDPVIQLQPTTGPQLPLRSPQGDIQGYLTWQLDMPGNTIFRNMLPYVLGLLGVLVTIALLLGRLAAHLQHSQLEQAVRLAAQGDALRNLALSKDAIPSSEAYAQEAADIARITLQLPHVSVWELGEDGETLVCIAQAEQPRGLSVFGQTLMRDHAPWLFELLEHKTGLVQPDLTHSDWPNLGNAGALLAMPTLVRDSAIGLVLAMNPWPRQWRPDETNFLASIADMLALSIELQARKRAEQQLARRSFFDDQTGLPNPAYLGQRVRELFADLPDPDKFVCVLVSIEGLVQINDKYGLTTGGELLVAVARRLEHFCGSGELVGRVGDNRFALVLDLERGVRLQQRMDMLFGFFASPVKANHISLLSRLNAGVSRLQSGDDWEKSLHNAEIALQTLHRANRENTWVHYSPEHHAAEQEAQDLREDLLVALGQNQLFVVYQPIVNLRSGAICGAEALLRWQHPTRGLIPPTVFIPLAEATGCIYQIGLWVMRQSLRQLKAWQLSSRSALCMSVNVSMLQLEQGSFAQDVCELLDQEGVSPWSLELEVTEGIALSAAPQVELNLSRLRARGLSLAIDDFGTGYASFSYLRRFEVGKLKIDRLFLEGVPDKKRNANLVNMIIAMGHTLNARVTGEGIETQAQAEFLRAAGCEFGQGYYFGRPVPAEEFPLQVALVPHSDSSAV